MELSESNQFNINDSLPNTSLFDISYLDDKDNSLSTLYTFQYPFSFNLNSEKKNETNKILKNPNDSNISDCSPVLSDILHCYICFQRLSNAHMCPFCSKISCYNCIVQWLDSKKECPHCRQNLSLSQLIQCRFMEDLMEEFEKIRNVHNDKEYCNLHPSIILDYYCETCQTVICSDCALLTKTHSNHSFIKLHSKYKECLQSIQSLLPLVEKRLQHLSETDVNIDLNIQKLRTSKKEKREEMMQIIQKIEERLNNEFKIRIINLLSQKQELHHQSLLIQNIYQEIASYCDLKKCTPSQYVSKYQHFYYLIEELIKNSLFVRQTVISSFKSELVPEFSPKTFILSSYSTLSNSIIYSNILDYYGLEWRLKIYPHGNDTVKPHFLSVFLELTSTFPTYQNASFEYFIQLCHSSSLEAPSSSHLSRSYINSFSQGESWGYTKFFKIEDLLNGFIINDSLYFQFGVRSLSYNELSNLQSDYIKNLEKTKLLSNELITPLSPILPISQEEFSVDNIVLKE